jgi:hypothetical protein
MCPEVVGCQGGAMTGMRAWQRKGRISKKCNNMRLMYSVVLLVISKNCGRALGWYGSRPPPHITSFHSFLNFRHNLDLPAD